MLNTADTTDECLQVFQQHFPHNVNTISFGILLKAYARDGTALETEQLLNDQIHLWEFTQKAHIQPIDNKTLMSRIQKWSHHDLAGTLAPDYDLLQVAQQVMLHNR